MFCSATTRQWSHTSQKASDQALGTRRRCGDVSQRGTGNVLQRGRLCTNGESIVLQGVGGKYMLNITEAEVVCYGGGSVLYNRGTGYLA